MAAAAACRGRRGRCRHAGMAQRRRTRPLTVLAATAAAAAAGRAGAGETRLDGNARGRAASSAVGVARGAASTYTQNRSGNRICAKDVAFSHFHERGSIRRTPSRKQAGPSGVTRKTR